MASRATSIARSMVMEYGMSRMGRINYRAKTGSAFLATPNEERTLPVSPETAREIDIHADAAANRGRALEELAPQGQPEAATQLSGGLDRVGQ